MTTIDKKYVNIPEKAIEDWLFENPEDVLTLDGWTVERWLSRQFKVPSGIIDLLGVCDDGSLIVVEVKNEAPTSSALTQVKRYAVDIANIAMEIPNRNLLPVKMTVIGTESVSDQLMFEANAMEIAIMSYEVSLQLELSGIWKWNDKRREKISSEYYSISENVLFDEFRTSADPIEQYIESSVDTDKLDEAANVD